MRSRSFTALPFLALSAVLLVACTMEFSPKNHLCLIFGCASPGARVVAAYPSGGGWPVVVVFGFLEIVPTAAWGEPQEPVAGMPTVTLSEDGEPTIVPPGGEPPAGVELAVLKKGDGAAARDLGALLVHYIVATWSDGTILDSSWETGELALLPPVDAFGGVRPALEGQTAGSQIIVIIPPEFHDGAEETFGQEVAGQTLVFVVDILGV